MMKRSKPFLSVIIPAYNEERRLPGTLEQVFTFLDRQEYTSEVLVVENGSHDSTYRIAKAFEREHPNLKVIHEEEAGKGLAVRRGMLEACGKYRFMCDADLSMPIEEINRFLPPSLNGFDVAIASREENESERIGEPAYRHIGGRIVNTLIRWLALPGLHDTQCGFKCFREPVAEDLFRRQKLDGWSFDIEVLYIARQRGYQIEELAIPWYYRADSRVQPVKDAVDMFLDILAIRRNARKGIYDNRSQ